MRYKPRIGRDLPLEIIEATTRWEIEKTRSKLALFVMIGSLLSLLVAGAIGVYQGNTAYLLTVWSVVAAPIGWVVGHYFRGSSSTNERDNKGST